MGHGAEERPPWMLAQPAQQAGCVCAVSESLSQKLPTVLREAARVCGHAQTVHAPCAPTPAPRGCPAWRRAHPFSTCPPACPESPTAPGPCALPPLSSSPGGPTRSRRKPAEGPAPPAAAVPLAARYVTSSRPPLHQPSPPVPQPRGRTLGACACVAPPLPASSREKGWLLHAGTCVAGVRTSRPSLRAGAGGPEETGRRGDALQG